MHQAKFTLNEAHTAFLSLHKQYGFKDKSSMLRAAIEHYKSQLEQQKLQQSADLYAEVYEQDLELQDMTASGVDGWPE